jgi:hypothetical protein
LRRAVIEWIKVTLIAQLDLERHGENTLTTVCSRLAQRILAVACVIWHNERFDQPPVRAIATHDH